MTQSSNHVDLRQAIKNLDALPAMPVIAQKLLALKLDTDEGEQTLLVLIEQDPQISAKLLGLANSPMVGVRRQILTVKDAVMLLGIKRVQSVATGIAIMSLMTKPPASKLNMQDLWLHCFVIAFAMTGLARVMPQKLQPQSDQIFLAGMLHDIGYLALAFLDPKQSDLLHTRLAAEANRPSREIELEVLNMCHGELGAELARHWNLPEEIITVLRYHHTPSVVDAAPGLPLAQMIYVVEKLIPSCSIIEFESPEVSDKDWSMLGISPSQAEEVKMHIDEQVELAKQFFSTLS